MPDKQRAMRNGRAKRWKACNLQNGNPMKPTPQPKEKPRPATITATRAQLDEINLTALVPGQRIKVLKAGYKFSIIEANNKKYYGFPPEYFTLEKENTLPLETDKTVYDLNPQFT